MVPLKIWMPQNLTIAYFAIEFLNPGSLSIFCLGFPPEIFVCIYNTFDNNFGIENDFTKYFKDSF